MEWVSCCGFSLNFLAKMLNIEHATGNYLPAVYSHCGQTGLHMSFVYFTYCGGEWFAHVSPQSVALFILLLASSVGQMFLVLESNL